MIATLSTEGRLNDALREMDCSLRNFVSIAEELGHPISVNHLSQVLLGKRKLSERQMGYLLEIAREMKDIRAWMTPKPVEGVELPLAWDWSKAKAVSWLIFVRRTIKANNVE